MYINPQDDNDPQHIREIIKQFYQEHSKKFALQGWEKEFMDQWAAGNYEKLGGTPISDLVWAVIMLERGKPNIAAYQLYHVMCGTIGTVFPVMTPYGVLRVPIFGEVYDG